MNRSEINTGKKGGENIDYKNSSHGSLFDQWFLYRL